MNVDQVNYDHWAMILVESMGSICGGSMVKGTRVWIMILMTSWKLMLMRMMLTRLNVIRYVKAVRCVAGAVGRPPLQLLQQGCGHQPYHAGPSTGSIGVQGAVEVRADWRRGFG